LRIGSKTEGIPESGYPSWVILILKGMSQIL
jgi:hypothetical protein